MLFCNHTMKKMLDKKIEKIFFNILDKQLLVTF